MIRTLTLALSSLACAFVPVQGADPGFTPTITLEKIMSEPTWIGRFPTGAYWGPKSEKVYYFREHPEDEQQDLHVLDLATRKGHVIREWDRGSAPAARSVLNTERNRMIDVRNSDLFLVEVESGEERQLTRTSADEFSPQFLLDGNRIAFRRGEQLFIRDLTSGLESEPAVLRFEVDPAEEPDEEPNHLEQQQERLFEVLRRREERRDLARDREREGRELDPTRVPPAWYLDPEKRSAGFGLSPDAKWLFLRLVDDVPSAEKVDSMPEFITESSWVESSEVRPHVGWRTPQGEQLMLLDLVNHERVELDLSVLPSILDPSPTQLTNSGKSSSIEPTVEKTDESSEIARPVHVLDASWSPDGHQLAIMLRSLDNKDRWIARVDFELGQLVPIHHLRDEAWIGWKFNEFGWLNDGSGLWFTSEETGYSQLYFWSLEDRAVHALTEGEFEIDRVSESPSGDALYFRANPDDPGIHEVCRIRLPDGLLEVLTRLGGRTSGVLSPDGTRLLLTHSKPLSPPELYVQPAQPDASAEKLTNFATKDFLRYEWASPEFVRIPALEGPAIHARVYAPRAAATDLRPAVVFVHGAGYLQNAHRGWSGYFREFMFHSFLVQEGFVVIDIDYRASAGYGRDWRTAIYRQMGSVELDDLLAALDWLVLNREVDPHRIGIYGGSYGGFLTLMALFNQPGLYACGAALRPVTDWSHYNHGYTSNILNTPQTDPEAFRVSSPIEFAEGLEDPLLICHGMLDDNVLVKDSIRLAQRLIELKKQNWELALYPVEAHAFREPSSWLDEYRRVFELFETHLK